MEKMDNKLIIGMPAGSLANAQRGGNLVTFLEHSGFKTKGYESGGPTSFTTINFLFGWDGRPQEFASQLALSELDIAIAGDDWIEESRLEMKMVYGKDIKLEKLLSLKRGNVRIVGIIDNVSPAATTEEFLKSFFGSGKKLLTVVSELPHMALDWIQKKMKAAGLEELAQNWSVQKYKTPAKIDQGILIYETWGKTEAKIKNGGADMGLEITQSGSALRNYSLKIIDEVFTSETGIWATRSTIENKEKLQLLEMFIINLFGTVNAENKVLLVFNVPSDKKTAVEEYLTKYNLYADEPTIIPGATYAQYTIQVETDRKDLPLAKVRYELIKMGVRSLDTLPLLSSIPDLSTVLKF